jgi:hypothetical protein
MKRPKGFVVLSLFFLYLTVGGIIKGLSITSEYGILLGGLAFIYGLAALVVAIGLWLFRPWAFHAVIIWAITAILRIFNMQYGLNADYTIPVDLFIAIVIIIGALVVLLLWYVKKSVSRSMKDQTDMSVESLTSAAQGNRSYFVVKSISCALALFMGISFINFAVTILLISKSIVTVAVFNTMLNVIPIYYLGRYLISPLNNRSIYILYWVCSIILSVLLVIPYGEFIMDYFVDILRMIIHS